MKNPESRMGTLGWAGVLTGIVAYEILGEETLSSAYDRYLEHPIKRIAAIGAVAFTGAHLLNILPPKLDLIEGIGKLYGKITS